MRQSICLLIISTTLVLSCKRNTDPWVTTPNVVAKAYLVDSTKGKNAYYFGDSITQGVGNSANRWTTLFSKIYQLNEVNLGFAGTTLEYIDPINYAVGPTMMQRAQTDIPVKTANDKWLFFAYGTNDCHVNLPTYNPTNFAAQYTQIINIAMAKGWPAHNIIIIGGYLINADIWNTIPVDATYSTMANRYLAFRNAAKSVAATLNCQYADPTDYMVNNGNLNLLNSDGIHLNDDGNIAVAAYLAQLVN